MPKRIAPLASSQVQNAKPQARPYKLRDGGGLFLLVTPDGAKLWRWDYRRPVTGKQNTIGLGAFPAVRLAEARELVRRGRELLVKGVDPSEQRRAAQAAAREHVANTFEAVASELLTQRAKGLASGSAIRERRLLTKDLSPYIGMRPIASVTAPDLLVALRKIEQRGAIETAHRAKMLAGQVFKYAAATGRVPTNYNPVADLAGALKQPVGRSFATIYDPHKGRDDLGKVGELLRALYGYRGTPVVMAGLKLAPLLFVRPGELRHAQWADIDLGSAEWRYLASKTKQPHIVPLSKQVIEILSELFVLTGRGEFVFPSVRGKGRPMSENTINAALRNLGFDADTMTGHGFRAMARTVLDEVLGFRPDYIEHQLAHAVKDANGRAYNRTAHLAERKTMMQAWADYLDSLRTSGSVVALKQHARSSILPAA